MRSISQSTRQQQRHAEREREQRPASARSVSEEPRRHAVEAEALLDDEGAVERRAAGRSATAARTTLSDQRGAVRAASPASNTRAQRVDSSWMPPPSVSRAARAAPIEQVDHAEARLRHRVVGGLLVRGERDRVGEGRRHRAAVRAHVAHLPLREPAARVAVAASERGEETRSKALQHAP